MNMNYIVIAWVISLLSLYFVSEIAQEEIDKQIESQQLQTGGAADR